MGLRDELQADIAEAFDEDLADAVRTFSGSRKVAGDYDPGTGTVPSITIRYSGRGVLGRFKAQEVDGQHILATDTRLKALQNEVIEVDEFDEPTGNPGLPKVGDTLDGKRVMWIGQDPAAATWTIQLRKA